VLPEVDEALPCLNVSCAANRAGVLIRVTVYTDIDEARAAAARLAQERG
jgi:hypothetical protein